MNQIKEIEKAEHLLYTTYPIIGNSKLLYSIISILNNISKSFKVNNSQLTTEELIEIQEIQDTVTLYKESSTVFTRKKNLVMWNGKTLKVLDEKMTNNYLSTIKGIINDGR